MSHELDVATIVDRARGVIAERFSVGIKTADAILQQCAETQKSPVDELAAAVVASTSDPTTSRPRSLYSTGGDSAAA